MFTGSSVSGQLPNRNLGGACSDYDVYAAALNQASSGILFVKKADTCAEASFDIYSLAPGRYLVVALPKAAPGKDRHLYSRKIFVGVEDYHYDIIKSAVDTLKKMNIQIFTVEKETSYSNVTPEILTQPDIQPGGGDLDDIDQPGQSRLMGRLMFAKSQ